MREAQSQNTIIQLVEGDNPADSLIVMLSIFSKVHAVEKDGWKDFFLEIDNYIGQPLIN